jgi:diaminopimelate epimerase
LNQIEFAKISGNGNNFIFIDNRISCYNEEKLAFMAIKLCAKFDTDGFISLQRVDKYSYGMKYINRDGSIGEICGNGARSTVRFWRDFCDGKDKVTFISDVGIIHGNIHGEIVDVNFENMHVGDISKGNYKGFDYYSFDVGVPHTVIFIDKDTMDSLDLTVLGREIRYTKELFPRGTNVNFAVLEDKEIFYKTYERGVERVTKACGTGAVAVAIIANLEKGFSPPVNLRTIGGELKINFSYGEGVYKNIFISGATNIEESGFINLE